MKLLVLLSLLPKVSYSSLSKLFLTVSFSGKIAKPLKKMLKKLASDEVQAQLAVADSKLGGIIREGKFYKTNLIVSKQMVR